jgi:hypothetical protein
MAWIFHLTARFPNTHCAHAFAGKYAGQVFVFAPLGNVLRFDEVCRFHAGAEKHDGEDWADICPTVITDSGIANDEEAWKADQFCNVMYGMLKNDRYFDYALIDVECAQFRTMEDLTKELKEETLEFLSRFDGLVISNKLYEETGKRECFQPFSRTHVWVPKKAYWGRWYPKTPAGSGILGAENPIAAAG